MDKNVHVVDINPQLQRMVENYETTHNKEKWKKRSIYKLQSSLTQPGKDSLYRPHTASIGPYHHGDPSLSLMEEHKLRAVSCFLKRSKKSIDSYINALMDPEVLPSLKESYDALDEFWEANTQKFVEIMIVDGCFMLEVMRIQTDQKFLKDYNSDAVDPIFSEHGKLYFVPFICRDMLKLENQLPFLVLYKLLEVETGQATKDETVNELVGTCYFGEGVSISDLGKCFHILDLYRKVLIGYTLKRETTDTVNNQPTMEVRGSENTNKQPKTTVSVDDINIPSAVQLHEAGIQFETSNTNSITDITFINGKLKLPVIIVNDTTETTYLNILAYERLHVGAGNEVTSYVFFMDNIIDNERDVTLLHKYGIVKNMIGSDKAAAKLFNAMSKDTTIDPKGRLYNVNKEVNTYCKKSWNEWRANFVHTYLSSPWPMISLVAALLLFGLSIVQTVFAVLDYYKK